MLRNRKSQQEMVGFVLIVVIVVIVGIIFLGINLRKNKAGEISTENSEISNFLSSSVKYTTDCVLNEPLYAELKDVIKGCYSKTSCTDGRQACDVVNSTYNEILDELWPAGTDRPTKYLKLEIYYQSDSEDPNSKNFFTEKIEKGINKGCTSERAGKTLFSEYTIQLDVCK